MSDYKNFFTWKEKRAIQATREAFYIEANFIKAQNMAQTWNTVNTAPIMVVTFIETGI